LGKGDARDSAEAIKLPRRAAESAEPQDLNELAWLLATSDDPKVRDGSNAVVFAERAVALTKRKDPEIMDTLAAAYAEAGQFEKAVTVQKEAVALMQDGEQRDDLENHLRLFSARIPYREIDVDLVRHEAEALEAAGKGPEAESPIRRALDTQRNQLGDGHPDVITLLDLLIGLLRREGKHDEAQDLANDVLAPALKSPLRSPGLLRRRADFCARRGRWGEAATDLGRAIELNPTDHQPWTLLAPLLAQRDDVEAYRGHCHKSLERFGATTDPYIAERVSKYCLMLPLEVADLERAARMAAFAVSAGTDKQALPWFQFCKGLAEYRQQHFAQSVELAHQALSDASPTLGLESYGLLALANYQLGHVGEAQSALAKANELADTKVPKLEGGDIGDMWADWLLGHALLREARGLIGGQTTSDGVEGTGSTVHSPQSTVHSPQSTVSGLGVAVQSATNSHSQKPE
jgi:tetratricopeptide (TPR) repeat protein